MQVLSHREPADSRTVLARNVMQHLNEVRVMGRSR